MGKANRKCELEESRVYTEMKVLLELTICEHSGRHGVRLRHLHSKQEAHKVFLDFYARLVRHQSTLYVDALVAKLMQHSYFQ